MYTQNNMRHFFLIIVLLLGFEPILSATPTIKQTIAQASSKKQISWKKTVAIIAGAVGLATTAAVSAYFIARRYRSKNATSPIHQDVSKEILSPAQSPQADQPDQIQLRELTKLATKHFLDQARVQRMGNYYFCGGGYA